MTARDRQTEPKSGDAVFRPRGVACWHRAVGKPHAILFPMRRLFVASALLFVACQVRPVEHFSVRDLVFLTRDGCVNTASMRSRLNEALRALALPTDYAFIDVDKLEPSDRRRGYGTPTLLYKNRDLFGMAPPTVASAPA
jgi:hypothetical protein